MASRHPIPDLVIGDVAADEQRVVKRLLEPVAVTFQAGRTLEEFAAVIKNNDNVKVSAAAGAGKSVRMPAEMYRVLGGVVVHCVPSLVLSVHLHDYVRSIASAETPVHMCHEVTDNYPKTGVVFTYSACFVAQVARFNSRGMDPGITLYMDECHESDAATMVIRNLRVSLPGVARYVESSATHSTGGASSPFPNAKLPSHSVEKLYKFPPAKQWDMDKTGVPWSVAKLNGNVLVFTDDEAEAQVISEKFESRGMNCYRMTAYTNVEQYRGVMAALEENKKFANVLILDYSYRSGFTFKGVTRILDICKVKVCVTAGGRTRSEYRPAYALEVYQAKHRGGRLAGTNCDYWRDSYIPNPNIVVVEGVEAEIACVWFRMLGFAVPPILKSVFFAQGMVPGSLLAVMCGKEALSCYACDQEWPGKKIVRDVVEDSYPLNVHEAVSDSGTVSSEESFLTEGESVLRARAPSIFTLDDSVVVDHDDTMSCADFVREQRKSVKTGGFCVRDAGPRTPAVPAIPERFDRMFYAVDAADRTTSVLGDIDAIADRHKPKPVSLMLDKYYALHPDYAVMGSSGHFPDGFRNVVSSAGSSMRMFLRGLRADVQVEAFAAAVTAHNDACVKYRALFALIGQVKERSDLVMFDDAAFTDWLRMVRSSLTGVESTMNLCASVMMHMPGGALVSIDGKGFLERESECVRAYARFLSVCVDAKWDGGQSICDDDFGDCPTYMPELVENVSHYDALSGRLSMRIMGNSVRERIARKVLGDRPVEVDVVKSV